jgi:hypothetical protein
MYSAIENRQKHIYPEITAGSVQNEQISCKKWYFLLLFLVNPLPLTILNIMSMTVVAIGCHLSLTIGPQQVIIMVISMILMILRFGDVTAWEICTNFKFQASVFSIHHGKHIFLVAADPVCHFFSLQCFQSTLIHQGR